MIPARWRTAAVLLAVSGGTLVCAGLAAVPAAALPADGAVGTIGTMTSSGTSLLVPLSATEAGAPVGIAGSEVPVTAQPLGSRSIQTRGTIIRRGADPANTTVMLVLDISGSMKGDKLHAEQDAAHAFLGSLPAGVKVGLVTFDDPPNLVRAPTPDHAAVDADITGLAVHGSTALFQAVTVAADAMPPTGYRAMVMVTDGDDSGDDSSNRVGAGFREYQRQAKAVLDRASRKGGISFQGVIIGHSHHDDLTGIAPPDSVRRTTGANAAAALQSLFERGQSSLDDAVTLRVDGLPLAAFTDGVQIDLTATTTTGHQASASSFQFPRATAAGPSASPHPRALPPRSAAAPAVLPRPVMVGGLVAVFLAMTVLVAGATGALSSPADDADSPLNRALSFYTIRGSRPQVVVQREQPAGLVRSRIARAVIGVINRVARRRQLDKALDARLEAAGLPIRTAEWTLLHVGSGIGAALLLLVASRGMLLGCILGLVIGLAGPWLFLGLRRARRESRFLGQLPDTLQLLAGSLAAGYSLPQAMDTVVREAQPPISVEFSRALIESRLGMPPEDALEGIAGRTGSRDFSWITMAIRIQKDVGGNLAELLSTVAETLRERERLRRQVRALSAEGRLSGIILASLPLVFALFLIFTKPAYIAPLFGTQLGLVLLVGGAVLLTAGGVWMAKVVTVEV